MNENNLLARALLAKRQLESLQSATNREYRDRIRKLQGAADSLVSSATGGEELIDTAPTLAPELLSLIAAPDRGL